MNLLGLELFVVSLITIVGYISYFGIHYNLADSSNDGDAINKGKKKNTSFIFSGSWSRLAVSRLCLIAMWHDGFRWELLLLAGWIHLAFKLSEHSLAPDDA